MNKITYNYKGIVNNKIRFVLENQLKNEGYWKKFTEVFSTKEDSIDGGWRGEYYGKMMRGASMVYSYSKDEELYDILYNASKDLLDTQESSGRISSYDIPHEFTYWDMWSRKYVMVGLMYFYDICRDEEFKKRIIDSLIKHADYIISKIGKESSGKLEITKTSKWWDGVNSCTILEPFVELYKKTGLTRFLDFSKYIIETGGIDSGDLIKNVLEGIKMPFEYEENKAYETMSFFEGVLAYYEATKEEKYLYIVEKFVRCIIDTDITIIGCSGCTHELFDNSKNKQTEYSETIMQETCVTVTWMRLLSRLNKHRPSNEYLDLIEVSTYNALYGSTNDHMLKQYSFERKSLVEALPFDSYSPLYNNKRGKGVGGFREFKSGGYYGCCACIASAAVALYPLESVKYNGNAVTIDYLINGSIEIDSIKLCISTSYPEEMNAKIKLSSSNETNLRIRVPEFVKTSYINNIEIKPSNSYIEINNFTNKELNLSFEVEIKNEELNGKVAYKYGSLVLALDQEKDYKDYDKTYDLDSINFEKIESLPNELVRFKATANNESFIFTDYQSCGKNWNKDDKLTVWIKKKN